MKHLVDLTGQKFGMLTVVKRAPNMYSGRATAWLCKCDCGKEKTFPAGILKNGNARSCGCINSELRKVNSLFVLKSRSYIAYRQQKEKARREFVKNHLTEAQALGMV